MTDRRPDQVDAFLADLGSAPVPADLGASVVRRIRDERPRQVSRTAPWMLLAAALVLLALAAVAWVVAGPGPTPVPNPSPSTPSAEPSVAPSASASTGPTASPSASPSPAPSSMVPVVGEASQVWRLTFKDGGLHLLPVLVVDVSGGITGVAPGASTTPMAEGPVSIVAGRDPDSLVVGWVGGACDEWTQVEVDAAVGTVRVRTLETPGGCDAIGIDRRLEIRFAGPVRASAFTGTDTRDLTVPAEISPATLVFVDATHGYVGGSDGPGRAVVAETIDGGATWRIEHLGVGGVTGLGIDSSGHPWAAVTCDETLPGCAPGVYGRDVLTASYLPGTSLWSRVLTVQQPTRLSVRGFAIVVLARVPVTEGDTVGMPPMEMHLSRDGGGTWATLKDPCAPDKSATAATLDGQARIVVMCEGGGATGNALKTIWRSVGDVPGRWETIAEEPYEGTGLALDLASDGTGLMWGPRSPLLVTMDGGAHWASDPPVADGNARMVDGGSALVGDRGIVLVWDPDRQAIVLYLVTYHGLDTQIELAYFPVPPS